MQLTAEEWHAVWLSLWVSTWAVALILPPGLAVAYAFARYRWPGKWLCEMLVDLPLVLPPVVTGYLLLLTFGRYGWIGRWLDHWFGIRIAFTWRGAALAAAVVSFPLLVRSIRLAIEAVPPRLEAAARTLGVGFWATVFRVSLPLAWRGIVAGCVLAFARSLGEFGATILVAGNIAGETQTIPLAIFSLMQQPSGPAASGPLVALAILLACAALLIGERLQRGARHA